MNFKVFCKFATAEMVFGNEPYSMDVEEWDYPAIADCASLAIDIVMDAMAECIQNNPLYAGYEIEIERTDDTLTVYVNGELVERYWDFTAKQVVYVYERLDDDAETVVFDDEETAVTHASMIWGYLTDREKQRITDFRVFVAEVPADIVPDEECCFAYTDYEVREIKDFISSSIVNDVAFRFAGGYENGKHIAEVFAYNTEEMVFSFLCDYDPKDKNDLSFLRSNIDCRANDYGYRTIDSIDDVIEQALKECE